MFLRHKKFKKKNILGLIIDEFIHKLDIYDDQHQIFSGHPNIRIYYALNYSIGEELFFLGYHLVEICGST